jgi:hypothetical protein
MIGMESMAFLLRNIIYILCFSVHKKSLIDWGHIISSEISFQLSNLKKTHKFYMTSYIISTIVYRHVFEDLLRERSVECKVEPIFAWYPTLWRHKA